MATGTILRFTRDVTDTLTGRVLIRRGETAEHVGDGKIRMIGGVLKGDTYSLLPTAPVEEVAPHAD
jgi:hypothetical protein